MVVSEPGLEKLELSHQALCKTWLSLLFPRQETEGREVFNQS